MIIITNPLIDVIKFNSLNHLPYSFFCSNSISNSEIDLFLVKGMKNTEKRTPTNDTRELQKKIPLRPSTSSNSGNDYK